MAFTKTPENNTYQTKEVNLFYQMNNRSSALTKDEDYLNVFLEFVKDKTNGDQDAYVVKRPGSETFIAGGVGSTLRGMHYNEDFRKLYFAIGTNLYVYDFDTATTSTNAGFFSGAVGRVGFCDYLYDTGNVVVCVTDGTTLKSINSAGVIVTCADADLPVHIPVLVFLDGYLFIAKNGTSDIYNSDLNDPMAWTPGNFISAEINSDTVKHIAKLNNYMVAFGSTTIEYFWDAGNASGSPLQRNDTPVKFNGYLGGVAQNGQNIFFVGNNVQGQPSVFMLEDLKIEEIADQNIIRYLGDQTDQYTNNNGAVFAVQGHRFYTVTYGNNTLVCDLGTKQWARWAFGATGAMAINHAVTCKDADNVTTVFSLTNGNTVYKFNSSLYQDAGTNFTCQGVTDNQYFDTMNQKQMHRLTLWADKPSASAVVSVSWSDDDYQTWTTARDIDLYQELPSMTRLGRFRRRAFKWSFTANQPFRLKKMEVDINKGQH